MRRFMGTTSICLFLLSPVGWLALGTTGFLWLLAIAGICAGLCLLYAGFITTLALTLALVLLG